MSLYLATDSRECNDYLHVRWLYVVVQRYVLFKRCDLHSQRVIVHAFKDKALFVALRYVGLDDACAVSGSEDVDFHYSDV